MSLFAGTGFTAGPSHREGLAPTDSANESDRDGRPSQRVETISDSRQSSEAPSQKKREAIADKKPGGSAANWSTSLLFAPTASRRPKANASSSISNAPNNVNRSAFTVSALPAGFRPAPSTALPGNNDAHRPEAIAAFAAPISYANAGTSSAAGVGGVSNARGETSNIGLAPALTLEGENGSEPSKRTQAHSTSGPDQSGREGKRRKKKKVAALLEVPVHVFQPDEPYDPAKPNDLQEYQDFRRQKREEARARRRREREEEEVRRRRQRNGYATDSSYYTEDEEDEDVPRRDAPKAFAPPSSLYNEPPPPPPPEDNDDMPFQPTEADLQSRPPAPTFTNAPAPPVSFVKPSAPLSGEEAYQRRLALSAQMASGSQAPSLPAHAPPSSAPAGRSFVHPSRLAAPAFTVGGAAPGAKGQPPSGSGMVTAAAGQDGSKLQTSPTDMSQVLAERKARLAEIAAKISADTKMRDARGVGGESSGSKEATSTATQTIDEPDFDPDDLLASLSKQVEDEATGKKKPASFAEKMMSKMGYQEGKGLGSRGDGIVHALAAERIKANKNDPSAPANNAMGRLVDKNENVQRQEHRRRYGEESEIICLQRMVGSEDEVDDDLSEDIGTECAKHGVVERVVIHFVEPPPPKPIDRIRVFVQFSGLAGAYNAVKELDGRMFAGRKVVSDE